MINEDLPTNVFDLRQSEFLTIPGNPWVYWVSEKIRNSFTVFPRFRDFSKICIGMRTGENTRFLRRWWEVGKPLIGFDFSNRNDAIKSKKVWFPYMKGGGMLKWYGNQDYIVNWFLDGKEIKENTRLHYPELGDNLSWKITNEPFYFRSGITWSNISSKGFSARLSPGGFIFDVAGSTAIIQDNNDTIFFLGILNSKFSQLIINILNPTINIQVGDVANIPVSSYPYDKGIIINTVRNTIWLSWKTVTKDDLSYNFACPPLLYEGLNEFITTRNSLSSMEAKIDDEVYRFYGLSIEESSLINAGKVNVVSNEETINQDEVQKTSEEDISLDVSVTQQGLTIQWLSYAIGILLGRFQPGTPGALGSAIYRHTDFAIGSLPKPTEEEFNELVGEPSQFAYIDEQGGRHIFSCQVEDALQKLAIPDGIAVFDPNHPRDLPTLVSKALELMLGQAQAQEVIQQAAGGDLRKFLEKDFFTQHHIRQYRKRPVYWPIQSSKRSYGFVLFHEKIDRNTFYALQQEPYLATKRRAVQLRLEELSKKVLSAQGAARKPIEKEMDELHQLAEELAQFAKDLDAITRGGYEPEADWIDDGVILRMAPLWSVVPLWKSEPKKYWDELAAGKYDWSHIAMKYWPERVKQACKKNKSFAIAHGHEELYQGG